MRVLSCCLLASADFSNRHFLACAVGAFVLLTSACEHRPFDQGRGIVLHGTIVTMDASGTIVKNGRVLVRNHKIIAVWSGSRPPTDVSVDNATNIDVGSDALIFPGLINLHDHPSFDVFEVWPAPSSHQQFRLGRPHGTEPYANRYQWNGMKDGTNEPFYATPPPEYCRLIKSPNDKLLGSSASNNPSSKENLGPEVGKYAQIKAIVGGETSSEGRQDSAADNVLIRNVEHTNFDSPPERRIPPVVAEKRARRSIESRVGPISRINSSCSACPTPTPDPTCVACPTPTPDSNCLDCLLTPMQNGDIDAWIVHLAEGVRDSQRRAGDTFSSRKEFRILKELGLLTDMTVIVHGIALEPEDFAAMRAAPSIRHYGTGDGLGAKLVWSPLSNLLLYGQTALVYQALKEDVVVSLGTDWSPSGSRNLLDELKIADITLRDQRLLGADRDLVPGVSIKGKSGSEREAAEAALDKLLVEMVTTNPAKTLRWTHEVGSIEPEKFADLMLITKQSDPSAQGLPDSPYRNLIDATERDVRLVLVNGEPLAGDVALMHKLKPGDYEVISCASGCFEKAIDVTNPSMPHGTETFASIQQTLREALGAVGGGKPSAGGLPNGCLNLEAIQLAPVFVEDDHFYFHLLGGEVFANTGLIADDEPPFDLYVANFNHVQPRYPHGNPFVAQLYRDRYFQFCADRYMVPNKEASIEIIDKPGY